MSEYVLGLGSNLGDRVAHFVAARFALQQQPDIEVLASSPMYESESLVAGQPPYANAALHLRTSLPAEDLLRECLRIEGQLGRVRTERWAPRTIDLDLLWHNGGPVRSAKLQIPHPELWVRPFALRPVLDLWCPTLGPPSQRHMFAIHLSGSEMSLLPLQDPRW